MPRLALALVVLGFLVTLVAAELPAPAPVKWKALDARNTLGTEFKQAIDAFERKGDSEKSYSELDRIVGSFLPKIPESRCKKELTAAREAAAKASGIEAYQILDRATETAITRLRFRPVSEANLPKGFPEPTPLDEIVVKTYPAYRLVEAPVRTSNGGNDRGAFGILFRHITSNSIPMTTPVEMTYGDPDQPRAETMAFLYESPEVGKAGDAEGCTVIDKPAQTVVSVGCRGYSSGARIEEARKALMNYLESRYDLKANGDLRVMGYNGPGVRGDRRYWELQVPVVMTAKRPGAKRDQL